ncbi:MAG: hypothetical protein QW416_01670 [Candidatus Nitrosocaldaceae archaeon]
MIEVSTSPILESNTSKLMDVFNVLSKSDAMTIFILAKDGLPAETEAPYKIGLTRKQYYTRLKQLVDLALIERKEGIYYHTTLGSLIYNEHVVKLSNALVYDKEMKMIDVLKKSSEFTTDEITKFLSKIAGDRIVTKCEIILSWEKMVEAIINAIAHTEKEVLLSSRFYEERIINAIIERNKVANMDAKVVVDLELFKSYASKWLERIKHDQHVEEREKVATDPWYGSGSKRERKIGSIPFSMVVIDSKICFLEFIDKTNPNEFYGCIMIKDENVAKTARYKFNELWNVAISEEKAKSLINS